MRPKAILPTWAARIKPHKIRRLYESDAQGIQDCDLIDEAGWALHARCQSFLLANAARQGSVACPTCRAPVADHPRPADLLACPACGWSCTYRAYLDSIRNQQLDGGPEVISLFQGYLDAFPLAKAPAEKMLLIDQLIHGFHHFLTSGRTRRPVGVNLIDGHLVFVVDFLDRLSYGPTSTPGVQQTYDTWRENIKRSMGKNVVR